MVVPRAGERREERNVLGIYAVGVAIGARSLSARNLAAYPEGRAVVWRRFVSFLDAPGLSAQEQDAVVAGAAAAFERFGVLLKRHFALD